MAASDHEPAVDAIAALVPATLRALHAIEFVSRHVAPATLLQLVETVRGRADDLAPALADAHAKDWPERLSPIRDHLVRTAQLAGRSLADFAAAPDTPQPILAASRAIRLYATACEALYPLAPHLRPVSHFFLEPAARNDTSLVDRLAAHPTRDGVGFMHFGGPAGTRGAFSLYVPEYYDPGRPWPLVVALHGGSGNGGAFLWSWLREARTRGFILLAPTAQGTTWSLMEPEIDGTSIDRMVDDVGLRWSLATQRLLTGMSDGGTFTYATGLRAGRRFTHLAPIAASFHPLLMNFADRSRLQGLPLHIVHGTQDWMFPPEMARGAARTLERAGARVVYREVPDLAHTYPRDENARILDWFLREGA